MVLIASVLLGCKLDGCFPGQWMKVVSMTDRSGAGDCDYGSYEVFTLSDGLLLYDGPIDDYFDGHELV